MIRLDPLAPLRHWLARPPRRPARRPARPRFRPALQQLEDRALPSTVSPPTIDQPADQTVAEDTNGGADHTFLLTGISPGAGFQQFKVQINWDNTNVIPQSPGFVFGSFSGTNPQSVPLTFTTAPEAAGTVHVTLTVTDDGPPANGQSPGSTVVNFVVNVTAVNDAVANPLSVVLGGGANPLQLTAADADGGQPAPTFSLASQPAHGTLSNLNPATGAVTYTPAPGYNGPDSFTFTATDGAGPLTGSSTAMVSLDVVQVTTPPPSSGVVFKGFQLLLNRKHLQLSKLRLDFGGNPNVAPGVFPFQVGGVNVKVKVVVTPSGGDTFIDLSLVGLPKRKLTLTRKLLTQLESQGQALVAQILGGGL